MKKIKYITAFIDKIYIIFILLFLLSLFVMNVYLIFFILLIFILLILSMLIVRKVFNHNPKIDDYLLKNQEDLKNKLINLIAIADVYQEEFNHFGYRVSFDFYYEQGDKKILKNIPKKNKNLYNPIIVYGVYEMKDVLCTQNILYDRKETDLEMNKMQSIYNSDQSLKEDLAKWLGVFYKGKEGTYTIFKEYYEVPYRLWKNVKYVSRTWISSYYVLVDQEGNNEFKIKYYGEMIFTNYANQLNPIDDLVKIEVEDRFSNSFIVADNTVDTDQPVEKTSPQVNHIFQCHKCRNDIFKIKLEYLQIEEQDIEEEKYREIEKDYKIISQCYYKVIITAYCTKCGKRHIITYRVS